MPDMQFRFNFNRRLKREVGWERFNFLLDHDGERVTPLHHYAPHPTPGLTQVQFGDGNTAVIFNSELWAE